MKNSIKNEIWDHKYSRQVLPASCCATSTTTFDQFKTCIDSHDQNLAKLRIPLIFIFFKKTIVDSMKEVA